MFASVVNPVIYLCLSINTRFFVLLICSYVLVEGLGYCSTDTIPGAKDLSSSNINLFGVFVVRHLKVMS